MKVQFCRISVLLFLIAPLLTNGETLIVRKNLRDNWKVYENNEYIPFQDSNNPVKAIYFEISVDKFGNDYLSLESSKPFALFVNNQLIVTGPACVLKIDSLARLFSTYTLSVGVYQRDLDSRGLLTEIRSKHPISKTDTVLEYRSTHFRDFVVAGMLVLTTLLVIIIRLNPRLASDYFSVTKIFSMREGDESQVYSRITSSTNILFYIFCSLLISYCLIIIFHFTYNQYSAALGFLSSEFYSAVILWLKLSLITLTFFFLKIVLVYCLTRIFNTREVAGIHFFNWVRLLLLVFGFMTVILSGYFILYGQSENFFSIWLKFLPWLLGSWMILISIKLSGKLGHSLFHLFSYICATEFIPFLITLKVLFS